MFQELEYSEEQNMIANFAMQLAVEYDEFYFIQTTKKQQYPDAFWQALSEGGYLGIIADESVGGVGLSTPDLAVFVHNMAKAGLASFQLINQLLCSDILSRYTSEEQKERLLPDLVSGEKWTYADLENSRGDSLFDIATTATKSSNGSYILNGQKTHVVGAQIASHIIVAARTQAYDASDPSAGIGLFVIKANSPSLSSVTPHINVRVTDKREEMSATGDVFNNLTLKEVEVLPENCLGEIGNAGACITQIASRQMLLLSLVTIGWGERLLAKTVEYANERVVFKDPISSYQAIQHPLVLAKTKVEMAKLFAERAAEVFDTESDAQALLSYCSVAKYYSAEAAYAACDIAIQTHGGSGFDRDTGVITLWPMIMIARLVPLNASVILKSFAEQVLQLPGSDKNVESQHHSLQFEARTDLEVDMLIDLKAAREQAQKDAEGAAALSGVMGQLMEGDLAKYQSLVLAEAGSAMPIKLDFFRQFAVYGNEDPTLGSGIPTFLVENGPVKLGLSAMAMAAISSGEGGQARVMNEYLPQMMQGKFFCYCITEPDAGTNTHKIKTVATDMGDHYLLNGQKTFISAADTAFFMAVIARVEVDGKKEAVGTFVMETKTEGISITELDIAALGDPQFTIYYDNVKLPKTALVGAKKSTGGTGKGISEGVFYTLNLERIMIALGAMKVGQESLERAIKKAKEPQAFGPILGASDAIKERIAKLQLQLVLANLAIKKATLAFDKQENSKLVAMYANMAKYLTSMFGDEAGQLALDLYGIDGLDKDGDDIGGLLMVSRVLRTVPINNEMVLNFLAENLMGLPKSYRV